MAANASREAAAPADQREVVVTRVFDAPRELVFRMWTEREHLVKWMRPPGFATVDCEIMDVRPGGIMRTRLRLADGTEYLSEWTYREITPPRLLVYEELCYENGKLFHQALQTISFDERGGKTTLTVHAVLELVPGRDPRWTRDAMKQGWSGGWAHNLDLLAAQLKQ